MKQLLKQGLLLAAFIIGFLYQAAAQSTQLVVFLTDGTEQTYLLSESDRLYFEDNTKLVIEGVATKSMVTIPLADIRKITCDELTSTQEDTQPFVAIYPNPGHNVLYISNIVGKQTVNIYALDGRVVKSVEANAGQAINISDLPQGLYLVNVNHSTFKMMKL